jgi:hypothetical protein
VVRRDALEPAPGVRVIVKIERERVGAASRRPRAFSVPHGRVPPPATSSGGDSEGGCMDGEGRMEASVADRSVGTLVRDAAGEVSLLMRKEVELARLEVREEVVQAKATAARFGVTAFCGYLAAVLLSFAAAWGLSEVVPIGVAFAIVGVFYAVVGGVAFLAARRRMRRLNPPEETVRTLKEDVEWLKSRRNGN